MDLIRRVFGGYRKLAEEPNAKEGKQPAAGKHDDRPRTQPEKAGPPNSLKVRAGPGAAVQEPARQDKQPDSGFDDFPAGSSDDVPVDDEG